MKTKTRTKKKPAAKAKPYTHIAAVLDRSGSMASVKESIIAGFNSFLADQCKDRAEDTLTLVQFDDHIDRLQTFTPLRKVTPLTDQTYLPRGSTRLLDAIGQTIKTVQDEIAKLGKGKAPDKVLVAIITDGQENASQEYRRDDISQLISTLSASGWRFTFIGSNQDAILSATNIGVPQQIASRSAQTYHHSATGVTVAFQNFSRGTMRMKAGPQGAQFAYTAAEQAAAMAPDLTATKSNK